MNREKISGRLLVVGLTPLLASQLAGACAESDGELLSVPYRTLQPSHDASALNEAADPNAGGGAPPPGTGLPTAPPVIDTCNIAFCPAGFGAPCCTPTGGCGIDLLGICLPIPEDGGAGGAPVFQPPPPPEVSCRSDAECTGDEVCCANGGLSTFACASSCGDTNIPISCGAPGDCPAGQICCGARSGQTTYTGLGCADTCEADLDIVVCGADTDCPDGTTCQASQLLPDGFTVCL